MGTVFGRRRTKISLSARLRRFILGFFLVITASFLISIYFISYNERRANALRESEGVLRTLSNRIESDVDKYKEFSRIIMTDDRLVRFLRADAGDVDIGMINDARYGVLDILYVTEGVDSVMVFRNDMLLMATNRFFYRYDYDLMNSEGWKKDIYSAKGRAVVSLNCNGIAYRSDNKPVLTIGREINDLLSQERTGLMLMNISSDVFLSMLHELNYDESICILGTDGSYVSGNGELAEYFDESFLSGRIVYKDVDSDKGKALISGCRVSGLPLVILRVAPYGQNGVPYNYIYLLLGLMALQVFIAMLATVFIRRAIAEPVFGLARTMDQNEQTGQLQKIDNNMKYSELDVLKQSYNNMIEHVNELITTQIEQEKNVQRMEMRVLQEQIKPHFLYNSLETIGYLALDAKADNVHDALETLGSFYRNFLSKGSREISLEREVRIVKDYLALQKLRYGDIIEDVYEISDDTLDFVVPKLILQPIVENSIYHGIRLKGEKGMIKISAKLLDGALHLTVTDTGVGMSREAIESVFAIDGRKGGQVGNKSFGLWDTIERIKLFCGREDVVKIESEIGEYTSITLIIPSPDIRSGDEQEIQSDVDR